MESQMHIYYDEESDYLEIRFGEPTLSYYEKIGPDVYARIDEKTGDKIGYAIFNVKRTTPLTTIDVEIPYNIINLLKKKIEKSSVE